MEERSCSVRTQTGRWRFGVNVRTVNDLQTTSLKSQRHTYRVSPTGTSRKTRVPVPVYKNPLCFLSCLLTPTTADGTRSSSATQRDNTVLNERGPTWSPKPGLPDQVTNKQRQRRRANNAEPVLGLRCPPDPNRRKLTRSGFLLSRRRSKVKNVARWRSDGLTWPVSGASPAG